MIRGELLWIQCKLHTFMWLHQRKCLNPWDELGMSRSHMYQHETASAITPNPLLCVKCCVTFCAAEVSAKSLQIFGPEKMCKILSYETVYFILLIWSAASLIIHYANTTTWDTSRLSTNHLKTTYISSLFQYKLPWFSDASVMPF